MPALDHPARIVPVSLPPTHPHAAPRPALPLQGLTLLAVEDSRFASEALRLLCQRSGARLRRAETLQTAARHLSVYRPDVVIVDLGLPDGDGADLIRHLAARVPVVLGTSGDPAGRGVALTAGAVGFLDKPLESLAAFQDAILRHLPGAARAEWDLAEDRIRPDPLALQDDLAHAQGLLARRPDPAMASYIAAFLRSIAQSARDEGLAHAARPAAGLTQLSAVLAARLAVGDAAFPGPGG